MNCKAYSLFAMDFAKAFDNVRHSILSDRSREALYIRPLPTGILVVFFFLRNRKQRLVFRGGTVIK